MAHVRSAAWIAALLMLLACCVGYWRLRSASASSTHDGLDEPRAGEELDLAQDPISDDLNPPEERPDARLAVGPENTATDSEEATAKNAATKQVFDDLRSAIESSTFERLDPSAIMQAALLVLELELGDPIPELTDTGEVVIPFVGTPDGLTAKLSVGRSQHWGNVLGLEMQFDPPGEPVYLNGVLRNEASCRLTAWTQDGRVARVQVRTLVDLAFGRMKQIGMPFTEAVEGVQYTWHAEDPTSSSFKAYGWKVGKPSTWEVPAMLDGGHLRAEQAEQLSRQLLSRHQSRMPKESR